MDNVYLIFWNVIDFKFFIVFFNVILRSRFFGKRVFVVVFFDGIVLVVGGTVFLFYVLFVIDGLVNGIKVVFIFFCFLVFMSWSYCFERKE